MKTIKHAVLVIGLNLTYCSIIFCQAGYLDRSFGNGGRVTTSFNRFSDAADVALQTNGRIVVVGNNFGTTVLARYHPDGRLDRSFGIGGRVLYGTTSLDASEVAIQSDDRIVVVGRTCFACGFTIVRYLSNGTLDTSFDGDGTVTITVGGYSFATDVVVQPDGKIVVVGGSGADQNRNYAFAAIRLDPDGSLDTTFDGDGKVVTSLGTFSDSGARGVALHPDGKIVLSGQSGFGTTFSSSDVAVVRYNPDGSLDSSFDDDGKVITDVSNAGDYASDVAIQSDGSIVAVGATQNSAIVVRYNSDGSLDPSFDGDGIVFTDLGSNYDSFSCVAIQSNGKIVAGGYNFSHVLARYNPNGSLDSSFRGSGIVSTSFPNWGFGSAYGGIYGVAIQPDGNIIGGGGWGLDGEFAFFAIARYKGD